MGFFSGLKKAVGGILGGGGSSSSTQSSSSTSTTVKVDAHSTNNIEANFKSGDTNNEFLNEFDNSFTFDMNKGLEALANVQGEQTELDKIKILQAEQQEKDKLTQDKLRHDENLRYSLIIALLTIGFSLWKFKGKK